LAAGEVEMEEAAALAEGEGEGRGRLAVEEDMREVVGRIREEEAAENPEEELRRLEKRIQR
jgi:hypothetical protein